MEVLVNMNHMRCESSLQGGIIRRLTQWKSTNIQRLVGLANYFIIHS